MGQVCGASTGECRGFQKQVLEDHIKKKRPGFAAHLKGLDANPSPNDIMSFWMSWKTCAPGDNGARRSARGHPSPTCLGVLGS
mmetsp:Transcript_49945/g.83755  ORF Transcript_49945/g.83755 Transcript_49945/m.83755 type:complete len:83 (-) Transcript_49945:1052-1300(-)